MQQERDPRVVDRLRELRTLTAANTHPYASSLAVPISVSPPQNYPSSSPQKKSFVNKLTGGLFGDKKQHSNAQSTSVASSPVDNSAAVEKFFADVEATMAAIQECHNTLDSLEPQCITILAELYLYKDEQERSDAVERLVVGARRQLMGLQETVKRFLSIRVPAEYFDACQRWRSFATEKTNAVYAYFLDRVAKLREIMRERRKRQLLIADPSLKEAELKKLLDSHPFEIFSTASVRNGLKPPQAPEHTEIWVIPQP